MARQQQAFIHSINLKKAGVGQPKYCNNAYFHVVLTNLCSIFSICMRQESANERYHNRRIHADVIIYIFAHLHTALRTERNMLDMN